MPRTVAGGPTPPRLLRIGCMGRRARFHVDYESIPYHTPFMKLRSILLPLALLFPLLLVAQADLVTRNQLQIMTKYTRYKLAEDERNQVRRLDLSLHELNVLPTNLDIFVNCLEFSFGENRITVLPDAAFKMKNLQYISGSKNLLGAIPRNIDLAGNLQELDLSWNRITGIPNGIGNLSNLRVLRLNNNLIRAIPYEFGQCANVEEVHMTVNQMERLPSSLNQLKKLRHLDVSYNYIKEVPSSIGELTELEYLDLSFNALSAIPDSIVYCEKLRYLDLRGNLTLKSLPPDMARMRNLKELNLKRTKLTGKQVNALQAKLPYCKIYF